MQHQHPNHSQYLFKPWSAGVGTRLAACTHGVLLCARCFCQKFQNSLKSVGYVMVAMGVANQGLDQYGCVNRRINWRPNLDRTPRETHGHACACRMPSATFTDAHSMPPCTLPSLYPTYILPYLTLCLTMLDAPTSQPPCLHSRHPPALSKVVSHTLR